VTEVYRETFPDRASATAAVLPLLEGLVEGGELSIEYRQAGDAVIVVVEQVGPYVRRKRGA